MGRSWLDKEVILNNEILHNIFSSYFNENNVSSLLDNDEQSRVTCLFICKLLNVKDCQDNKKIKISYRDIFGLLLEVFDSLKKDDVDLTTECYELTLHFHKKISEK